MAYFLFVDESGQDGRESPYEVLAGVAIEDRDIWNLVKSLQDAEVKQFGIRYKSMAREIKAKRFLNAKSFRLANQLPSIPLEERREHAKRCLESGESAGKKELTSLAQSKIAYVQDVLDICSRFRCKAFASIVSQKSQRPIHGHLRKDYAYLFERFYYFLEDKASSTSGIVVFDELDRSQSHILIEQMERYFRYTLKGRQRAGQIIPEPFFVHSDLTTAIQVADFIAYIISWGVRFSGMEEPARLELQSLADQVCSLRYRTIRETEDLHTRSIWSFTVITDLRPRSEQEGE